MAGFPLQLQWEAGVCQGVRQMREPQGYIFVNMHLIKKVITIENNKFFFCALQLLYMKPNYQVLLHKDSSCSAELCLALIWAPRWILLQSEGLQHVPKHFAN